MQCGQRLGGEGASGIDDDDVVERLEQIEDRGHLLDGMSVPRDRVEVIVSKEAGLKAAIPLNEAKRTLDVPVTHSLARDQETAIAALNKGLPLREVKASSPLSRSIAQLAEALIAPPNAQGGEERKRRKGLLGGLFAS